MRKKIIPYADDYGIAEFSYLTENPGSIVVGVDEVARGTLAGNMYAAAVACNLEQLKVIKDLVFDSKLTGDPELRAHLADTILKHCVSYGIGKATVSQINSGDYNLDELNQKVMEDAIAGTLAKLPATDLSYHIFCDATRLQPVYANLTTTIKGEMHHIVIAAASILAKHTFDEEVKVLHSTYPEFHFNEHSGYGTKSHIEKIKTLGYLPVHRTTYRTFTGAFKFEKYWSNNS